MAKQKSAAEVANAIENFLDGDGGEWDWDNLISESIQDPELDRIRSRCASLPEEFPSATRGRYCADEGIAVLREYVRTLRERAG